MITRRAVLAVLAAIGAAPSVCAKGGPMVIPFTIPPAGETMLDLRRRLEATRWTDTIGSDWSYGTEGGFLRQLIDDWTHKYDWAGRRAALNRLPHRLALIDDYPLHFLHYRSGAPDAVPLLLMNGWPSSFVEYQRLAPMLSGGAPSFDVVLPTLPGFGFSGRPTRPYQIEPSDIYPRLMTLLGHDRFMVAGTDIGSGVATRIALHHPDRIIAAHVSAVAPRPSRPDEPPPSAAERDYEARASVWERDEGGYQAIQSSRPQTLAFALADSPVGLASWIVEKFRAWSDCNGDLLSVWPTETLIDNLMIYWTTNTIGSSMRYYFEAQRLRPKLLASDFVTAPTAVSVWPKDLAHPPRELAERLYNVRRYTAFARGGHFPAWEAPDLYAHDIRTFAADVLS